ncbi:MAG: hypothetical protein GX565_18060, partial [Lentisphaerae bacterium]|nr:hypothetical protein [Lentisphaerota bacterium]
MNAPLRPSAWGLLPDEWKPLCKELGLPPFRAAQIATGLYQTFALSWNDITTLPAEWRERLSQAFDLAPLEIAHIQHA